MGEVVEDKVLDNLVLRFDPILNVLLNLKATFRDHLFVAPSTYKIGPLLAQRELPHLVEYLL